jgi:predicted transposase YbfD/YdcC
MLLQKQGEVMDKTFGTQLLIQLSELKDPRSGQNNRHLFIEVIFIAICAIISGCECWTEIEDYGHAKREWLSTFLKLKGGIPSHDTFRRIFCILDFKNFQIVFINWAEEMRKDLKVKKDQICIDGKTLCGSFNKSKEVKALHMVNAWSTETSISLGQIPTAEKSNEITAIPALLELINIKDCLVSIDAMGCQTDIAEKILSKGGSYLLALKENQKGLYEATEELFRRSSTNSKKQLLKSEYEETERTKHGRDETRTCKVLTFDKEIGFFPHEDWPHIQSLIRIESERINRSSGEISNEVRYYISDAIRTAREFNESVRKHWEVENKLHWSLDVAMNEDSDKKWAEESAKNFSLLRQLSLNLLKKEKSKMGIRRKQKMAAMDNNFLLKILFAGAAYKSYA